jgi:hypothetical protein
MSEEKKKKKCALKWRGPRRASDCSRAAPGAPSPAGGCLRPASGRASRGWVRDRWASRRVGGCPGRSPAPPPSRRPGQWLPHWVGSSCEAGARGRPRLTQSRQESSPVGRGPLHKAVAQENHSKKGGGGTTTALSGKRSRFEYLNFVREIRNSLNLSSLRGGSALNVPRNVECA